MDIYEILISHKVPFEGYLHPPAVSCEEADKVIPFFEGAARTKSLFLRDAKGNRHFLVVMRTDRNVDFKTLSGMLSANRVCLASEERLQSHLDIAPGCLSLLAILKDVDKKVELAIDADIFKSPKILCHPWINTATLILSTQDVQRLLCERSRTSTLLRFP